MHVIKNRESLDLPKKSFMNYIFWVVLLIYSIFVVLLILIAFLFSMIDEEKTKRNAEVLRIHME